MISELTLFHPSDPLGEKIGGAETFANGIVRHAPLDIHIRFIGVSSNLQKSPPGRWQKVRLGSKEFDFLPLIFVKNENLKTLIPLSLRYTIALNKFYQQLARGTLIFNRIEPAILFRKSNTTKIAVVHTDVQKNISRKYGEMLWSKMPFFYFIFEKFLFKSLNYIFTVSQNTLQFYRKRYSSISAHFEFIPTFVDSSFFHLASETKILIREKLYFPADTRPLSTKKWILFVGRLQMPKNPILLIDSFNQYFKKNPSSCLIIVGEGSDKAKMQKHIKNLLLEQHVFFTGPLTPEILASFYQASDVLILTSNYEGMPMCVLEALGCGLPVVATDTGEIRKVVKKGFSGEITDTFSPDGISQFLEKVLNNSDQYKKENCASCVRDFQPEKVLAPLYNIARLTKVDKIDTSDFNGSKHPSTRYIP